MVNSVPFSLAYSALKMFGKQLYSNVGAAISELVANGFDAGANDVYVAIDARNKAAATIEILDNGDGMSPEHIRNNYVKIGYNKREHEKNADSAMGRKGIGKLAALYMSNKFVITSKTKDNDVSSWELDVTKIKSEDEAPNLVRIDNVNIEQAQCYDIWNSQKTGTFIYLENVDLIGFGKRGLESLQKRLSNYFLLDELEKNIYVMVILDDESPREFKKVEKQIAFKNMVCIFASDVQRFENLKTNTYKVDYTK